MRIKEARILHRASEFSGAYYLAGYSVECALKACIAKGTQRFEFPDKGRVLKSYVHDPGELLKLADLSGELQQAVKANANLNASWKIVNIWSEESRYAVWGRADAHAMIEAVANRRDGVLPWIRRFW